LASSVRLPAIFFGHGSPMNAIEDNRFSRAWRAIGESLPKPRGIVFASAHWSIPLTAVTASDAPRTIHDFGGFPQALHEVQYPAPGDPALAAEVARLVSPVPVTLDTSWGFDHGAWSVLMHVFPKADVPVIQISIDESQPPSFHLELGRRLAPLRERDVLLFASGNVVHNLDYFDPGDDGFVFDWARRFDDFVRDALVARDDTSLVEYDRHPDHALAAPDREHFLPLLVVEGARADDDRLTFPVEGLVARSISMRSVRLG
jgi:4,5-DOPA dioxygenase extradiol